MQGSVDGFSYGLVTPVVAYLMACLGGALGLRCTTRSLLVANTWRVGWLALGSAAIGSGIWTMHFIAMMGFSVEGLPIRYDPLMTFASLGLAILMVGIGVFIVGYKGATSTALFTGGTITGLGVASMHYLGMAGMRLHGTISYNTFTVVASVVIAMAAATAALWAAVQVRGIMWSLGASLVMGLAVSGMHYMAMAGVSVHAHTGAAGSLEGDSVTAILGPMLIGPLGFLLLAGVVVVFDPMLVTGRPDWRDSRAAKDRLGTPAPAATRLRRPLGRSASRAPQDR
jgi:NO-binding membrane sensor protein with MHYT domain